MAQPAEPTASKQRPDNRAPDYVLEQQIGYLLRRAHQRASAIFAAHMSEFGLTPTQFAALAKIHDAGPVSQNKLGRLTAMDPATMQGVIGRLHDRGLIRRSADENDRRRTLLTLTDEGESLLGETIRLGLAISDETLAPLSPDEKRSFLALLGKLV